MVPLQGGLIIVIRWTARTALHELRPIWCGAKREVKWQPRATEEREPKNGRDEGTPPQAAPDDADNENEE